MSETKTDDPDYELLVQLDGANKNIAEFSTDRISDGTIRLTVWVHNNTTAVYVIGRSKSRDVIRSMLNKARAFLAAHRKLTAQ